MSRETSSRSVLKAMAWTTEPFQETFTALQSCRTCSPCQSSEGHRGRRSQHGKARSGQNRNRSFCGLAAALAAIAWLTASTYNRCGQLTPSLGQPCSWPSGYDSRSTCLCRVSAPGNPWCHGGTRCRRGRESNQALEIKADRMCRKRIFGCPFRHGSNVYARRLTKAQAATKKWNAFLANASCVPSFAWHPVRASKQPRSKLPSGVASPLKFATANVSTLSPASGKGPAWKSVGCNATGRVQILENHFCQQSVDIVGIQEARIPESQVKKGMHYKMIISGADKGTGGVQTWLAWHLNPCLLLVNAVSPRILIVVFCSGLHGANILVVNFHAHILDTPIDTVMAFYCELKQAYEEARRAFLMLMLFSRVMQMPKLDQLHRLRLGCASHLLRMRMAFTSALFCRTLPWLL